MPPVAVAKIKRSTPHHPTTPITVPTKIPMGIICLADLGTRSFCNSA